jgi:hypothetical protein
VRARDRIDATVGRWAGVRAEGPQTSRRPRLTTRQRIAAALGALTLLPLPVGASVPSRGFPGDCAAAGAVVRCLFRSSLPSVGLLSECEAGRCRVGFYYGSPDRPEWLPLPEGWTSLPPPGITWPTATLAEIRFDCGPACSVSYFFEGRRRRLSPPRRDALALDHRRLLVALAEGPALVVRQVYSGREVARIERDWAPGGTVSAVRAARFDPDGRLSFTWLRGTGRQPVAERVSVPSMPR